MQSTSGRAECARAGGSRSTAHDLPPSVRPCTATARNAPAKTSNVSQVQAEAKQKALEKEKLHQEALNSDTVAIDFAHPTPATPAAVSPAAQPTAVLGEREEMSPRAESGNYGRRQFPRREKPGEAEALRRPQDQQAKLAGKSNPMAPYDFDSYQGQLYRVFEGTVLEGVVTNHIDGGLNGPILIMLTTDYYSHDHQQLLMPQGTRTDWDSPKR